MNRKILCLIGGIIFFLAIYLVISYSFFDDAVNANEKHVIKQSRISIREASDRMATFLNEQSESLQMLALFHQVHKGMSDNRFGFMEKISFMELTSSDIFLVIDKVGNCEMVTPKKYSNFIQDKNFAKESFFQVTKMRRACYMSKAIPLKDPSNNKDIFFIFSFIPIYSHDNSFKGIIGIGFKVENLFYKYFKPLETSFDDSVACVTDIKGNIEVFKDNSLIKKNSSYVKPTVLPPIPKKIVREGYHGAYLWKAPDAKKSIIIYHPINIEKNMWIAQFKIPYDAIDNSLLPFYWKLFLSLLVLILIASIGIIISIKTARQIRQLKNQIDALEIQIDHKKKKAEVEQITSSDFFQELQEQAEKLKRIK